MLTSVVTFYDNETGPSSTASLLYPPPSSAVSNRKSGIRNPNNRRIFKRLHFSNRKYSAISCPEARRLRPTFQTNAAQPDSNRDTAIKTPNKRRHFNHFQFSNRDKTQVLHPERISVSLPPRFFLSKSLCLRASVANLCDNGWLKLRLM
jgi:hypothetical protein